MSSIESNTLHQIIEARLVLNPELNCLEPTEVAEVVAEALDGIDGGVVVSTKFTRSDIASGEESPVCYFNISSDDSDESLSIFSRPPINLDQNGDYERQRKIYILGVTKLTPFGEKLLKLRDMNAYHAVIRDGVVSGGGMPLFQHLVHRYGVDATEIMSPPLKDTDQRHYFSLLVDKDLSDVEVDNYVMEYYKSHFNHRLLNRSAAVETFPLVGRYFMKKCKKLEDLIAKYS